MSAEQPKRNNFPRFSLTWIYVLVGLTLIYLLLMSDNRTGVSKTTNFTNFQIYVSKGYAERIVVNKTDGQAVMEVKPEYVKKIFAQQQTNPGGAPPTVVTKYPSVDNIANFLEAETKNGHFKGTVTYEESSNFFFNLIGSLLPFILLIAIYLFFFRRMSGGGSGGGGRKGCCGSRRR